MTEKTSGSKYLEVNLLKNCSLNNNYLLNAVSAAGTDLPKTNSSLKRFHQLILKGHSEKNTPQKVSLPYGHTV